MWTTILTIGKYTKTYPDAATIILLADTRLFEQPIQNKGGDWSLNKQSKKDELLVMGYYTYFLLLSRIWL